jgi:putative molybdopterin biosynthesis protein
MANQPTSDFDKVYLHDLPLAEARERFRQALDTAGLWQAQDSEEVPLDQALGRVTAEPVWARVSSPHYHAAAMDGYALRAGSSDGASDRSPISLQMGSQAQYLDTGDALPEWADAVVPIEAVEPVGPTERGRAREAILLRASVAPWSHVRALGEDMVATELVLPAGHTIRPVDLGAVAGCGHDRLWVRRKPSVGILPTGTELVPVGKTPEPGEILEFNSLVLAAQVESWGGVARRYPIVSDDLDKLELAVRQAAPQHDLLLINAGSSAGLEDFTARVVEQLGEVLAHGVAVRPGHPVILGLIHLPSPAPGARRSTPVIGVPGYPVSAALTGEIFVEPLLAHWLGRAPWEPERMQAVLTRKVHSSQGDDEYLRVTVGRVGDRWVASPLARGAGVITSLVRADGIVLIPAGIQGLEAGEPVEVRLYRPAGELTRTIVALGSHDLTLDLISQELAQRGARLTSANLGSQGGLIALSRGEAHLAGSHLLDPDSGEFNLSYIRRYLPNMAVTVVALVFRQQGLMVAPGNPKAIQSLGDLIRPEVSFINRQRGSGTRLLLDHHLGELGLDRGRVQGYAREEFTHMMIAAAVASGRADCGLGIEAAAEALGLDFIPLMQERYDLVIPKQHYESPLLAPLLELLHDERFQGLVSGLKGYDPSPMGKIIAELGG